MKYTVFWTPSAERNLAELWLQSPDREVIRSAADTLDSLLRVDAHRRGESRYESLRVLLAAPLGIDVDVDENDRTVWVLRSSALRASQLILTNECYWLEAPGTGLSGRQMTNGQMGPTFALLVALGIKLPSVATTKRRSKNSA